MSRRPEFRFAESADAVALLALEREASEASMSHLFSGAAYPAAEVLARWRRAIDDPEVSVLLSIDHDATPAAFVAWDARQVRHLAVRPSRWGSGLGRAALSLAVAAMPEPPRLWVLAGNERARRFYDRLGWRPTGATRRLEWVPHPCEMELELRAADLE